MILYMRYSSSFKSRHGVAVTNSRLRCIISGCVWPFIYYYWKTWSDCLAKKEHKLQVSYELYLTLRLCRILTYWKRFRKFGQILKRWKFWGVKFESYDRNCTVFIVTKCLTVATIKLHHKKTETDHIYIL